MMRPLLVALVACVLLAAGASAQTEAPQDMSMMEVGAASTISAEAAAPLQEVAQLLVEANRNVQRLSASRNEFNVISNHIRVRREQKLRLATPPAAAAAAGAAGAAAAPAAPATVNAQLVPPMRQPRIHDAQRFGTRNPIDTKRAWVDAEVVGEDGKPFVPRKQYGVTDEPEERLSPFHKFIQPPAVGSSADVFNKDPNTKLTPVELRHIESLQRRLKGVLDQLGANIVWDHSSIKNRRLMTEFADIKVEARALMEEYELRTGVKTISWQLGEADMRGEEPPNGLVRDIYFGKNPELAGRQLQRPGDRKGPPPPTPEMIARARREEEAKNAANLKPKEQLVDVAWKKQADGVVKAKVSLNVVDGKTALASQQPNVGARKRVKGRVTKSGKALPDSAPVSIDVVAPVNESLVRNLDMAAPAPVDEAPAAAAAAPAAKAAAPEKAVKAAAAKKAGKKAAKAAAKKAEKKAAKKQAKKAAKKAARKAKKAEKKAKKAALKMNL